MFKSGIPIAIQKINVVKGSLFDSFC